MSTKRIKPEPLMAIYVGVSAGYTDNLEQNVFKQQECLSALCSTTFNIVVYAGNDFN